MIKKSLIAAAMALLLAGPVLANKNNPKGGAVIDYPLFANVPEAAVLDGMRLKSIVLFTTPGEALDEQGQKRPVGEALPFDWPLRGRLKEAVAKIGFQTTGNDADPSLVILVRCSGRECSTTAWIQRDTYVLRVEGKRQYFLKLPGRFVAEYFDATSSGIEDMWKAQEDAAVRSVGAVLRSMVAHMTEGNSPEALAEYRRWFETSAAPQGAPSKAARKKSASR